MNLRRGAILDIAGYDASGGLSLAVEVKALSNKSAEWAAQLRQGLCAEGYVPAAAFWMLALRDRIHVWVPPNAAAHSLRLPDFSFGTPAFAIRSDAATEYALATALSAWLDRFCWTPATAMPPSEKWVVDCGLHAALHHGHVALEAAAAA